MHGIGGAEGVLRHIGAQDVEAVERGFGGDAGRIADEAQVIVGDGDLEVLGDLAAAEHGADRQADLGGAAQWLAGAPNAGLDGDQLLLGGVEQLATLAGALGGKRRIAADDQPFAGIVRAGDLGEIAIVE